MMYPIQKVVIQTTPRRGGWVTNGPLLAICCMIFILFVIASVIVLALIPLYLPTKDATAGGFTRNFSFVLTPNTSLGFDSNLDETSRNIIADAISTKLGFSKGATTIDTATLVTTPFKRKRRGFNLMRDRRRRRAHYKQQLFLVGRFKRRICGECRIVVYKFTIVVVLFIDGFFVAIEFIVEIFVIVINHPLLSTTSTTAISSPVSTTSKLLTSTSSTTFKSTSSTTFKSTTSTIPLSTGSVVG